MMDISVLSFDEVKTLAKSVKDFKIHHKTGEVTYRAEFQTYINEHPGCLGDENTSENLDDKPKDTTEDSKEVKPEESKEGFVKIKSIHRGKIGSSVGEVDFGTDGEVEVTVKQADHFLKIEGFDKC